MENIKLKGAISRIMSDLIKLDSLITADELTFLDGVFSKYGVTKQDRKMGSHMTLSEAFSVISSQCEWLRKEFYGLLRACSTADGQCSRPEALLLMAYSSVCGLNSIGTGKVYSFEARGIPLHRDQLIYISKEDQNEQTLLTNDEIYEDINNIAKLSGFELVYAPKIAQHFTTYEDTDILRKVLLLVRPSLERSEDELIRQLRGMTPYKFYTSILERRLKLSFQVDSPSWLIKLGNSQVGGLEFANFLLLRIGHNVKLQLKSFMAEFLKMQPEQMLLVSPVEMDANNFRYNGFFKSLLDMISLGTDDRWDVVIRLRGCKSFVDADGNEQKAAISIRRGNEEWPFIGPDRDAAFYALILCYTAENPSGVYLSKDFEIVHPFQLRYKEIYSQMSVREVGDCPQVCFSDTRRPIKSRLAKLIREHNYLTEKDLYQLSSSQQKMFIVLNPSNVFVQSKNGRQTVENPLRESMLYRRVSKITV